MKFIKGRWFPLTVAAVLGVAVALVMGLCGWRITYAPELENGWDAISAVAAWVGVIVSTGSVIASFSAVWFAIQVPQKIADEQDRISLFEKRHEAYSSILSLEVFADALDKEMFREGGRDFRGHIMKEENKVQLYCVHFATTLGYAPQLYENCINVESVTRTINLLKQYEVKAMMLPFLFYTADEDANEMKEELSAIFEPLLCFMTEVTTCTLNESSKINDENRENFIHAIKKFKKNYGNKIERELSIKMR